MTDITMIKPKIGAIYEETGVEATMSTKRKEEEIVRDCIKNLINRVYTCPNCLRKALQAGYLAKLKTGINQF